MSPSRDSGKRYAAGGLLSSTGGAAGGSALARRARRNKETIGVNSAIAAIPNSRNVTSTPSDDELGLYPHFTARIFPRRLMTALVNHGSFKHALNCVMHVVRAPMQSTDVGIVHMPVGGFDWLLGSSNQMLRA